MYKFLILLMLFGNLAYAEDEVASYEFLRINEVACRGAYDAENFGQTDLGDFDFFHCNIQFIHNCRYKDTNFLSLNDDHLGFFIGIYSEVQKCSGNDFMHEHKEKIPAVDGEFPDPFKVIQPGDISIDDDGFLQYIPSKMAVLDVFPVTILD